VHDRDRSTPTTRDPRLARLIAERTPGELNKIFFTNGGADANEHAVRMARLHTRRYEVLTRYHSYHGGTATAINLTGDPRRWPNDYSNSGVVHFFGPFLYRPHFHAGTEQEETARALAHLDDVIRLAFHRRRDRAGDHSRDRGHHGAAAWLPRRCAATCATATASSLSPMR
jgi:4-aminobutyrate aminotransferase-like enzyme